MSSDVIWTFSRLETDLTVEREHIGVGFPRRDTRRASDERRGRGRPASPGIDRPTSSSSFLAARRRRRRRAGREVATIVGRFPVARRRQYASSSLSLGECDFRGALLVCRVPRISLPSRFGITSGRALGRLLSGSESTAPGAFRISRTDKSTSRASFTRIIISRIIRRWNC